MKKLSEILTGPETWLDRAHQPFGHPVLYEYQGRYCLVGAVAKLHDVEPETLCFTEESPRLIRAIRQVTGEWVGMIPAWQDDPARTWEEITAVVSAYDADRLLTP